MASNKKIELVQKTYDLLSKHSPEDVKIRTIAAAANCTSTVIYKHFDDLDHLVLFASVKFLEDYIIEVQNIVNTNSDPYTSLVAMWEVFAKYAFQNVEVFDLLFWGKYKERMGDTIFEYYQMFPDEIRSLDGLFTSVFFNNDINNRNDIMMHRAAATGYFSYNDAKILSQMECCMFRGLLLEYKDIYRQPGKAEEGQNRFKQMLHTLLDQYRLK